MRGQTVLPGVMTPRKPAGGYCLIPVIELAMTWWCYHEGLIKLIDLRAWLACHELRARRCRLKAGEPARFVLRELLGLVGGTEKRLRGAINRLQATGLLTWSESAISFGSSPESLTIPDTTGFAPFFEQLPNRERRVPVPRRMIRMLAGGTTRAVLATVLAHLLRCMYFRNGGCEARGTCKASWVAKVFGLGLSRVKAARKHLVELGWLLPANSPQWRLNRYGPTMVINLEWSVNLSWSRTDGVTAEPSADLSTGEEGGERAIGPDGPEMIPPPADFDPELIPPGSDREPLREYKNQEPAPDGRTPTGGPAGILISEKGGEEGRARCPGPTTIRDVTLQDLSDTARTLELHRQAVELGLVSTSESDRLRFLAAAEHARVIGKQNPSGLFVRLVRGKLWHYLTQDDEDAANARLKKHLFGGRREVPLAGQKASIVGRPAAGPNLSEDARLVHEVRAAALRAGFKGDPFHLLRRESAGWTRERFDRAASELETDRSGSRPLGDKSTHLLGALPSLGTIISASL